MRTPTQGHTAAVQRLSLAEVKVRELQEGLRKQVRAETPDEERLLAAVYGHLDRAALGLRVFQGDGGAK